MTFINIPIESVGGITELTGDVTTPPDSSGSAIATLSNTINSNISNALINDNSLRILQAIGSNVKGLPFGSITPIASVNQALSDGYAYFSPIYIPTATTITGLRLFQFTNGDYVADNTNQVGLYTFSGGTVTKVAESSNDGNLWKAGANNYINATLSTPYAASVGCYYVGIMYNSSSQTTQPRVALCSSFLNSGISTFGTTGVRLSWNQGPNTSLQSTYDVTTAFNNGGIFWVVAY